MLVLSAPMQGWVAPLDEAPDAVFAGRVLGDGVAIDPTEGRLFAPCDGCVVGLARTRHAVTLRTDAGAEILMHVGLDTVALGGEGFEALVAEGQAVRAGDPLLAFDLDLLAGRAASLLSPVVVTNGEAFEIVRRASVGVAGVGDFLLELRPLAARGATAASQGPERTRELVTGLSHGLHARPAALVAEAARSFAAEVTLAAHGRTASARSAMAMMTLSVRAGDRIALSARGPDAAAALEAVAARLEPVAAPVSREPALPAAEPERLTGVRASPGLAIGVAARLGGCDREVAPTAADPAAETRALQAALAAVRERTRAHADAAGGPAAEVLAAHAILLADPALVDGAAARIAGGASAGAAWRAELRGQADALAALGDARMAERRADLRDLERQVLAALADEDFADAVLPEAAIVLADELLPSELAALDPARLAGVVMAGGGATSHVAIIAASMGVPMLAAAGEGVAAIADGAPLLLDADAGVLHVRPSSEAVQAAQGHRERRAARRASALARAQAPAVTLDGVRIEVFANLGHPAEAAPAVAQGAEGCGLLRSEFLFQDRATPPDEEEQRWAYQAVADGLSGRPLIVRTLDIGADKPAPWLALPREENPALGLRGVRTSLARPDLLRVQLRALLRVRAERLSVMLPMVASRAELQAAAAVLTEEAEALAVPPPPLGIMVETPAAAVTARTLARDAAFFSIGTNDLTQYALAMDRTQPALAAQLDGLHPAVLALLAQTAQGAAAYARPVGVCGGLASDLAAVPLLIGLGVTELSAAPAQLAEVKAVVRALRLEDCRAFAREALDLAGAREVRAAVAERWPELADA